MVELSAWQHAWKLDPDKHLTDADLSRLLAEDSDAVIIGGTQGITHEKTESLLYRVRTRTDKPVVLEVSDIDGIVEDFDRYLIPVVLNAAHCDWIVGRHLEAVKKFQDLIPWESIVAQAYIIFHAASAAAGRTGADTALTQADARGYAVLADRLFRFPVVYAEYSGMFGRMDVVRTMHQALDGARLFYGGGVDCADKAREAAYAADTVIVGNAVYENLEAALPTVEAVKTAKREMTLEYKATD